MKTKSFLQITACMIAVFLSGSPLHGSIPAAEEPMPIIIFPVSSDLEGSPKSLSTIRIEAVLYEDDGTITVHLQNAGTVVTVTLDNFATGDSYQYLVSGNGTDNLSFSPNPGFWYIRFTLSDGAEYYGAFVI